MNQAEVVHAGWVHRDLPNLSLLDACQADVRDAVTLDIELKAYEQGTAAGGTGPSYIQSQRKKHSEQVKWAKQLGQDMFCPSQGGVGYKIDPKSKHRPRNNAATAGKKGSSLSSNFIPQKSFPPEVHSWNQMYLAAFRDMSSHASHLIGLNRPSSHNPSVLCDNKHSQYLVALHN